MCGLPILLKQDGLWYRKADTHDPEDESADTAQRISLHKSRRRRYMPENTDNKEIKNNTIMEASAEETYEEIPMAPAGRPTAAFVLGIASIVLCVLPFMLIGAVVGLMLEKESEHTGYHRLQKPAKILCIIGIVLCCLAIAVILGIVFALGIISR